MSWDCAGSFVTEQGSREIEDRRDWLSLQLYRLSNPCPFLDLCHLSPSDLGPVCHDRTDAGTVSSLILSLLYSLLQLARSSSRALIKWHPQNVPHLGHHISIYFYSETPVFLLFLLFLCSAAQPRCCNTFMRASMCPSNLCRECVFWYLQPQAVFRSPLLLDVLNRAFVFFLFTAGWFCLRHHMCEMLSLSACWGAFCRNLVCFAASDVVLHRYTSHKKEQ